MYSHSGMYGVWHNFHRKVVGVGGQCGGEEAGRKEVSGSATGPSPCSVVPAPPSCPRTEKLSQSKPSAAFQPSYARRQVDVLFTHCWAYAQERLFG